MDRVVADGVGGGVREQLVQQGVEFLTHPSVAQVGLGQRMRFLRNKGLSSEEVDEALVRAEQRGMTLPSTLQPRGQDRSSAAKVCWLGPAPNHHTHGLAPGSPFLVFEVPLVVTRLAIRIVLR